MPWIVIKTMRERGYCGNSDEEETTWEFCGTEAELGREWYFARDADSRFAYEVVGDDEDGIELPTAALDVYNKLYHEYMIKETERAKRNRDDRHASAERRKKTEYRNALNVIRAYEEGEKQ